VHPVGDVRARSGPTGQAAPRPSGGTARAGHSTGSGAHGRDRDRERVAHRGLLARREGRPVSAGAGPPGGCRRTGGAGKSDASRTRGTGRGRLAGGRGDRGGPPGSAGAAGPRRGDSGRGPPGDTAGCSRRGRDRTRDRGRRAAGTGGRPASGGSPRPHGPGDVRVGWTNAGGCATPTAGRSTPPTGWNGPGAWSLLLQAPIPSPPGSRQPTRKLAYLPLRVRLRSGFLHFSESDNRASSSGASAAAPMASLGSSR